MNHTIITYQEPAGVAPVGMGPSPTRVPLNTVVRSDIVGASFASGVVSLPAGTYEAFGIAGVGGSKSRLLVRDVNTGVVYVQGVNNAMYGPQGGPGQHLQGVFDLSAPADVELVIEACVSLGLTLGGSAVGGALPEIYAQLSLTQQ